MTDTIAAISTGLSASAIGIIRISGSNILEISSSILRRNNKQIEPDTIKHSARKALLCELHDGARSIDQILFLYFPAPHSFTGEDMAEFHLHGNQILLKTALDLLFQQGARPAEKGEFSKRAFLNNKMGLADTEAINRIIHARSRFELELAQKNVFGELSRLASQIRSELINLKAECEAEIDFSTEDLTFETQEQRKQRILALLALCQEILKKSARAEAIVNNQKIVLFGAPNTGKSSLLNRLVGKERAIISEIPGTTRDFIAEDLSIEGIPVRLVDTAGVRETDDKIEKMGIEKSLQEFKNANIKIFMIDVSLPFDIGDFIKQNPEVLDGLILVANKIDAKHQSWSPQQVAARLKNLQICEISCKTGEGLEELMAVVAQKLKHGENSDDYVFLEERHRYHFQKIVTSLERTTKLMAEQAFAEIYIKEINTAIEEIGFINGKVCNEEVLGRVFSRFCVGK